MKNFKDVSDSELLSQVRIDAANERRSGLAVIHQLREIALRRLDAKLGYSSLEKFCMEELKYSPGSAWRRVRAMRALQELPEFETRLEAGELTIANVSQVQSFCEQQGKTAAEKREILEQVSGLSKRETEQVLAAIAPLPERSDKVRRINATQMELRVTLGNETLAELEKIRDLMAHAHPGASYAEVVSYLAKLGLKKLDPAAEKRARKVLSPGGKQTASSKAEAGPTPGRVTDAIPAPIRRAVWRRDGGKCTYRCEATGRVCGTTRLVQADHIIPRAKGGTHELGNLRLRCRRHNLLAAIAEFGTAKMSPYVRCEGLRAPARD
jgi:hypothetical protein